jgi:hypothetical protein
MEAASFYQTSANIHEFAWFYIPTKLNRRQQHGGNIRFCVLKSGFSFKYEYKRHFGNLFETNYEQTSLIVTVFLC